MLLMVTLIYDGSGDVTIDSPLERSLMFSKSASRNDKKSRNSTNTTHGKYRRKGYSTTTKSL